MSNRQHSLRLSSTPQRRQLSNHQLRHLLRLAKEDPKLQDLFDVVSIISLIGLRRLELENLLWADVDFANGRIRVASPMSISDRYVPLGTKTRSILKARRDRDPGSDYVLGKSPQLLLRKVQHQLLVLGRQIRAGSISLYSLRQTFFRILMEAGADATVLMSIGGYRSFSPVKSILAPPRSANTRLAPGGYGRADVSLRLAECDLNAVLEK